MYFKLAVRNVRKSMRDYLLYFLTLSFAVCIFYVFNSIEAQEVMLKISSSEREILKTLTQLMNVVSVFVSIILGFLIVSANHLLIRRRKKELGIYLLLGMKKSRVSSILVIETLFIGMISLGIGLLAGDEPEPRENHGLARAGLASERGEAGVEREAGLLEHADTADSKLLDHRRRQPSTGRLNLATRRAENGVS